MLKFGITFNGQRGMDELVERHLSHLADVVFYPPTLLSAFYETCGAGEQAYAVILHEFLGRMKKLGVGLTLAHDHLCTEDDRQPVERIEALRDQLKFYWSAYGVGAVRIASPLDGRAIKAALPNIRVHCSVNMFIGSVQEMEQVGKFADLIVLDRDINRDLSTIAEIRRRFGKETRLLANEGCVFRCVNRVQHLNRLSHLGPEAHGTLPCAARCESDPSLSGSPLIRPEEAQRYAEVVDALQLETGSLPNRDVAAILDAYVTGKHCGRLFDLVASPGVRAYLESASEGRVGDSSPVFDGLTQKDILEL